MSDKYVVIIGSGKSGSSAVFNYYSGRIDFDDPLNNNEFELIHDPCGMTYLDNSLNSEFSVNGASYAIDKFEDFAKDFASSIPHNKKSEYLKNINNFISNITLLSYKGMPRSEFERLGFFTKKKELIFRKINSKIGLRYTSGSMRMPVDGDIFFKEACKLVDSIFEPHNSEKKIIVDQGGSFWNPVSSTKYFGPRKLLIVVRDPRDIFSEFKVRGFAYPNINPHSFSSWYRGIMEKISKEEWSNSIVKIIKFEDFVLHHDKITTELNNFLNISNSLKSSYLEKKSLKNIGIYRKVLSSSEIKIIEDRLEEYLHL